MDADPKLNFGLAKLCITIYIVLLFDCSEANQDGMTLASVCPGDQLTLTCHTTPDVTLLQWTITFADRSGSETRFLSSRANTDNAPPLTVGQTVFQFLRISTSPLTSMMVIDNVAAELNGTRVECSYGSGVMTTNTQIINVIGNGIIPPIPVIEVNVTSVQFENETVVMVLEWTVESGAFSGLSVVPQSGIMYLGSSSRQLVLSYNILYNVSAVASLCGQNSSHSIKLLYVNCGSPLRLISDLTDVITDNNYPAVEGTTARFSCSSGYVLTGSSTAICMGNGEWVPDPRQVQCEAIDCGSPSVNMNVNVTYNSTLFDAKVQLTCTDGLLPSGVPAAQCYSNGSWTPNPAGFTCESAESGNSSTVDQRPIIAAVVSSVIMAVVIFVLGCASGWFGRKYKEYIQTRSEKNTNTQPAPLYEDLRPISTSQDQEKAFELKENVAYGPVRAT